NLGRRVSTGQKIWKTSWRLGVCLALLAWIFHAIFLKEASTAIGAAEWRTYSWSQQAHAAWVHGPPRLWSTLTMINPAAFCLSVLLMGLTILLGIARWRMVLRVHGFELSWGRAAEISFVAHFFNSFLLGSTGGDLLKAYYAARETHHKKTQAVVTVVVDRLLGLFAMLVFACLMMVPNLSLLHRHKRLAALAGVILLMTAGCGLVIGLSFWRGFSRLWPR